jgi:hypothetical protein
MNSPFYDAEQRALYPHRILVTGGKEQILQHMKNLIEKGIETERNLRKTSIRELKDKYYINSTIGDLIEAFNDLKQNNPL